VLILFNYCKFSWESRNHVALSLILDLQNIALGKATQNQPENSHLPSALAVDGNSHTSLSRGSCTETGCCTPLPWWRVDFGSTALIYSINVTSRGDCCGNRLSDFNVRVGDSNVGRGENNTLCQQNIAVPQGQTSTFICNPPMYGRYLYVQTNIEKRLPLCEVEVYGETFMKRCWFPNSKFLTHIEGKNCFYIRLHSFWLIYWCPTIISLQFYVKAKTVNICQCT